MNDFTKEELELMADSLYFNEREHHLENDIPEKSQKLIDKLQSMIENYCEHDWRKGVHLFNDVYCTKCKLHFKVNNEE